METLQKLTRRQVDALQAVAAHETASRGVPLGEVAEVLEVSAPSALEHLGALELHGLVSRYRGKTRTTSKGLATLEEYQRHHRVAEAMFGRMGLAPEESCTAAREVDLALTHRTVEQLCEAEGHPEVCPHGETIPHEHRARGRR
ncbi:MAG: hypothetical protein KGJ23_15600 [Euryarchaeota archaeon]|nr:hypothetical protein [Euryarchaeota archaeon]MDE1838024.1 hypothetical protein [Euryarchaeota archaeon]MDE1880121.1 hypothetical protein [Euryarchaeota archaeon]MDE2045041.1 hypothetical protein [Thermoplasmata archaeon]